MLGLLDQHLPLDGVLYLRVPRERDFLRRRLLQENQRLRQRRNEVTNEINKLKKQGKDIKEKIQEALHGILQKAVPMIPRKSILRIEFKTIQVREGKMVEARFFIPSLYDEGGSLQKISDLLKCRPGIHSCFGQLWIEFLKEKLGF